MRRMWAAISFVLAISGYVEHAYAFSLPCRHEDLLAEAAASILIEGRSIEPSTLLPEVRALGFDGVAVHAHEGVDDDALVAWFKNLSDRADGPLVCGEAASETRRLVLVSIRGGRLRLEGQKLVGELEPGFAKPHLVLEPTDGATKRVNVTLASLREGFALPAELTIRRVQLVAEGPNGPRPVAELVLDPEARRVAVRPPQGESEAMRGPRSRPVESLIARVDSLRRSEGVGTLRPNQLLTDSAQRHATRVCELGRVGHRLGQGDDPETRLREEHVSARGVGEAVARAESADAALAAMFDSPSHRMAVVERHFTDVGVGQALDARGHTCLVVLLAAWPRRIP